MKKLLIVLIVVLLASCDLLLEENFEDNPIYFDVLGYNDYYNGDCIALKMDIHNNTGHTVTHIRPEVELTYTSGSTQTFYPDIYTSLASGDVAYSQWVGIACGSVWYSDHEFGKILYWDNEGNMYSFDY